MDVIKKGDKIKVEYVGMLEDGTVFDSSEKQKGPIEFIVGEGQVITGFDNAVVGMKKGEEKEVEIPPDEGYGQHQSELVKELPRECFPPTQELKVGMIFIMNLQDGRRVPFRVVQITEKTVTIDLNPPLVGQKLKFRIKIVDIAS